MVKIHGKAYWLKAMLLLVVILTAREYARSTYDDSPVWAEVILLGQEERPYVLRALTPLLARLLWMANVPADQAITLVVVTSAIICVYAVHFLCRSSQSTTGDELWNFLTSTLAVELFMIIFFYNNHIYDLSTAAFFATCLGLMATRRFREYYILFPLACLNRETTILLSLFFAIHFYKKVQSSEYILGLGYQVFVFATVRLLVTVWFADNPGSLFYFFLTRVLRDYLSHPIQSFILLSVSALIGTLVIRSWREKSVFLRSALLILLPVQFVLHLSVGMAFEMRVLAEIYPVIFLLGVMGISRREPSCIRTPARQQGVQVVDIQLQPVRTRSRKRSQR